MNTSEVANLLFQWISVLDSVKHKFFNVSIVNKKCEVSPNFHQNSDT